jgi:integrase
MKCIGCKKEIDDISAFCLFCGKKQIMGAKKQITKSRGNGTGSVFQYMRNGKVKWRAAITVGYDCDENGKRKRVYREKSGFPSKKAALEYIAELKKDKRQAITVHEAYNEIMPKLEKLSDKRRKCYESAYKRIKHLETRNMNSLSLAELQALINKIEGGYYSKRYVKDLLSKMFNFAFVDGLVDRNIAPYIELPKNEPVNEKEIFTNDDISKLWASWNNGNDFAGYILIIIYCALRTGELWTIKSKNVNFESCTMHGGIKTNKGKHAPIFIVEYIEPVLKHFVDLNPDGTLYDGYSTKFYREWVALRDEIGIKEEKTPYSGRHACATILTNAGLPEAVIMAIMRHEKYDTTLGYTHIDVKGTLTLMNGALKKEFKDDFHNKRVQ